MCVCVCGNIQASYGDAILFFISPSPIFATTSAPGEPPDYHISSNYSLDLGQISHSLFVSPLRVTSAFNSIYEVGATSREICTIFISTTAAFLANW